MGYLAARIAVRVLNGVPAGKISGVPLLDRVVFNLDTFRFEDTKGREFTETDWRTLLSKQPAGKAGVGSRSTKRAVVTASVLRALHGRNVLRDSAYRLGQMAYDAGTRPELQAAPDSPELVDRPPAQGILYQNPAAGGVSASRNAIGL